MFSLVSRKVYVVEMPVRTIVDKIIDGGNTVSICAIDLSKAFDKLKHQSLFIKLTKRHIPVELLELLENWLFQSSTCVKWGECWSHILKVNSGVRQGSVLSPFICCIIDDIGNLQNNGELYSSDRVPIAKL